MKALATDLLLLWVSCGGLWAARADEPSVGSETPLSPPAPTGQNPYPPEAASDSATVVQGAWWQTNQPPSELTLGPQYGTTSVGGLIPTQTSLPPIATADGGRPVPPFLRWGPISAHPSLAYGITYGNGFAAGPASHGSSTLQTLSPGLGLTIGEHWSTDFAPLFTFYNSKYLNDTINQYAAINGAGLYLDWEWTVSDAFNITDNPLVETGRQTKQTINLTQIGAIHEVTKEITLNLGVSENLRWAPGLNNVYSWSSHNSVNYEIQRRLSLGLNADLGYDDVEPGTNMRSEQLTGSVRGAITSKISYKISGGFEFRQFLISNSSTRISPTADAGLDYAPTEKTSFSAHINQAVSPSYFNGLFNDTTSTEFGIHQRLLGRLNLFLSGGYRWVDLVTIGQLAVSEQHNDFRFLRGDLSLPFLTRGTVTVFLLWSDNKATQPGLDYLSHQIGLNLSYHF